MSGHAQGVLAQLRQADTDESNIDVDPDAITSATADALREHADELDDLRRDADPCVDTPLADTTRLLRDLADALDNGITDPDIINEYLHTRPRRGAADASAEFERQFPRNGDEP